MAKNNPEINVGPASCPVCGSTQIQAVSSNTQGFDAVGGVFAGLIGALCLGPIGLICVLCGMNEKIDTKLSRLCLNCGHQF